MSATTIEKALSAFSGYLITIFLAMGATVLALMMFLTAIDVVCRYLLNYPIPGAFELVEFMMAIFVPFAVVYCEKRKKHIAVDILTEQLPDTVQKILNGFTTVLMCGFFLLIAWQSIIYIGEEYESKMTSSVLLISNYPFTIPVALAFVVLTLLLLHHLLETLSSLTRK
jgi:TRAP-type C4-dicarboxylate transport system permease small subunit